jgi:hypothetical protein
MFKKIADMITYPVWVTKLGGDARFKTLDLYDRLLDGTFYDHLNYAFYDETDQSGAIVKLVNRRPSAQYRLPRMVARWSSRKMFAGRHAPKIRHEDKGIAQRVTNLLRRAKFQQQMSAAVLMGSVGSVAITFRVERENKDSDPKIALSLWRAKYCVPSFDTMGDLAQLRVQYPTCGAAFIAMDVPGKESIIPTDNYWYVRDYLPDREITYLPVKYSDWNPVDGFVKPEQKFEEWETTEHKLGFVPGHWFRNLPGASHPDGCCTFEDAIPNSIELDFTLSQIGRGVRYNSAPTLVVIGKLLNDITRGTMQHIQLEAGFKNEDGMAINAGDAKLLEMSGTGTTAALAMIKSLRDMALEQIAASRKDPEKTKAPLSGRAMEYLDEDANDLIMDLRSQYGDNGALPLIRKIMLAAKELNDNEVTGLSLQWPRLYQPTPDEIMSLVTGLVLAMDPMKRATPATPGQPAQPGAEGKPGKPAMPAQEAVSPDPEEQLLTFEEARTILRQALDITMLDVDDEEISEDTNVDESPTPPDEPTPAAPEPTPIDQIPPSDQPALPPAGDPANTAVQQLGGRISGPVRING